MIWSFFQSVAITIVVMLVHTYYGYTAHGGPAGWVKRWVGPCGVRWW